MDIAKNIISLLLKIDDSEFLFSDFLSMIFWRLVIRVGFKMNLIIFNLSYKMNSKPRISNLMAGNIQSQLDVLSLLLK